MDGLPFDQFRRVRISLVRGSPFDKLRRAHHEEGMSIA
ncbi:hypothetical protein PMI41_02552 [Phyllobacterium sp. YR531]|nr:hypothetical protein PMI41_02552 [Phyllobacterium sp. YR531]